MDILINISASPYHVGKASWVKPLLRGHALNSRAHVVYVNQVGGNDELIFQGHSVIFDPSGNLVASGADFREDFVVYDTESGQGVLNVPRHGCASESSKL